MKNENIKKIGVKAGVIAGFIFIIFIVGLLIGANISETVTNEKPEMKESGFKKIKLPWLGQVDPGLNVSGVREVYLWKHSATPATTYAVNLSNASADCYGFGDINNSHLTDNCPFNTPFDVVELVQWNYSHAFNETSGFYDLSYIRAYANCSDLSVSGVIASDYEIWNQTEQVYIHHVWNNGGAGFTISRGQNITSFYTDFEGYYIV